MKLRTTGIWAIVTLAFFVLCLLLSLLLVYTRPPQLTVQDFAKMDPQYENSILLSEMQESEMHYYLVKTQSGETHLIPTRQHAILPSRWKICENNILSIPDPTAEQTISLRINPQRNTVILADNQIVDVFAGFLLHTQSDTTIYITLSGLFAYLTLYIADKLRGYA